MLEESTQFDVEETETTDIVDSSNNISSGDCFDSRAAPSLAKSSEDAIKEELFEDLLQMPPGILTACVIRRLYY